MNLLSRNEKVQLGGIVKKVLVKEMVKENEKEMIQETTTIFFAGVPIASNTQTRCPGLRDAVANVFGNV